MGVVSLMRPRWVTSDGEGSIMFWLDYARALQWVQTFGGSVQEIPNQIEDELVIEEAVEQLTLGVLDKMTGAAQAAAAKPDWVAVALDWIAAHPRGSRLNADDLTETIGTPTGVKVNANNAIGAVFLSAKTRKWVKPVDRVASRRRTNHGRFITVWERI